MSAARIPSVCEGRILETSTYHSFRPLCLPTTYHYRQSFQRQLESIDLPKKETTEIAELGSHGLTAPVNEPTRPWER